MYSKNELMAEKSVSTTWKTKKRRRESAARLRELKRAKMSASATAGSSSSDPSITMAPGSSSSDPSTASTSSSSSSDPSSSRSSIRSPTTHPEGTRSSDDERSEHSESENERDPSGSSDDESDFDDEKAQGVFDEWVVSLPLNSRRMLSVMLMETLQKRFKIGSTAAALEAAWMTGFNKKTVRGYKKEFFENHGKFRDEARGKYKRFCLFNDEALPLQASMWIRENSVKKGAPNMVARELCLWVNNEL